MDFKSCLVVLLLALAMVAAVESSPIHDAAWGLRHNHDDVGDLIGEDNEMLLDSEVGRRQLAGRPRFISYGALKRNHVPCGQPGAAYYNCNRQNSQAANVYRRGCSVATRCARSN
ncbi:PREDICTED: protein RALF-like 19 [Fragaria vesca subsp. vesca]|uniref:protein RALF-like 19 n=1 Tax=Fragaria vesca subsp. vesca TaxID=101020 RepID=UPI0002C2EB96